MLTKVSSQASFYKERQRLADEIQRYHDKMFVAKVPFDPLDWAAVQDLSEDPIVQQDWSLAGPLEDMLMVVKSKRILDKYRSSPAAQAFQGLFITKEVPGV